MSFEQGKTKPEEPRESPPLLPVPFAFVCAGVLATIAAQLWVTADDFWRLYEANGVELPFVVDQLMGNQVLLPLLFLTGALAVLTAPRVVLPLPRQLAQSLRQLAMLVTLGLTGYAGLLAYSHGLVFNELQKQLQQ